MAKIKLTKRTRKFRFLTRLFRFLSWFSLVCPLAWFTIAGFMENNAIYEKFAISGTLLIAGFITAICSYKRILIKSKIWITVLAMVAIIETFLPILVFTAICEVINELVFTPAIHKCEDIYIANLEQDRRIP